MDQSLSRMSRGGKMTIIIILLSIILLTLWGIFGKLDEIRKALFRGNHYQKQIGNYLRDAKINGSRLN